MAKYIFLATWLNAYICAYLIQQHLLSCIEFYETYIRQSIIDITAS